MESSEASKSIVVIAGETSGDFHGAHLVQAMKKRDARLFFCGIGAERLKAEGVRILMESRDLSVVGVTEVLSKMPKVLSAISAIRRVLDGLRPDLVILIDFPDFNLHIARLAKKRGVSVLYYISPQIWAWRSGRIKKIRRFVDQMAVILPFEEGYYKARDVQAAFVGHPLLDYYQEPWAAAVDQPSNTLTIGILPGSRRGEIEKILPVMLAAVTRIQTAMAGLKVLISIAPGIDPHWLGRLIHPYLSSCRIETVPGDIRQVFENSCLILAASGTVTLETAIFGVPMIIIYRVSAISYQLGRALVDVDHIGLVNIIAGERIVPELIQGEANPGRIAREAVDMLKNKKRLGEIRQKLQAVRDRLGKPGAAEKTADIAFKMLETKQTEQALKPS